MMMMMVLLSVCGSAVMSLGLGALAYFFIFSGATTTTQTPAPGTGSGGAKTTTVGGVTSGPVWGQPNFAGTKAYQLQCKGAGNSIKTVTVGYDNSPNELKNITVSCTDGTNLNGVGRMLTGGGKKYGSQTFTGPFTSGSVITKLDCAPNCSGGASIGGDDHTIRAIQLNTSAQTPTTLCGDKPGGYPANCFGSTYNGKFVAPLKCPSGTAISAISGMVSSNSLNSMQFACSA
jgi:hypothetical protein